MTSEATRSDAAAAILWSEFSAPLRSFIGKRVPSGVEADDVVQEVFLRIHERLPHLRDAERIDAWIFQIARNVLADAFRARRRNEALASRIADEIDADTRLAPSLDQDRSAAAELAACLAPMVERLAAPYRGAIELTELGSLTQAQAATQVGLSVSGMKSRVQRGREHLKAMLDECCRIELDVRGGVIDFRRKDGSRCDPLRPSSCSTDSMGMTNTNDTKLTESQDTTKPDEASGCCGGPATADASACCALDEEVKATGGAGCGCAPKAATTKKGCC